jgi:S1-C subfamily serine protease
MLKRKEFILGAAAGLTLAAAATAGGVINWPGAHADPQAVNRLTPVPANGNSFSPPPGAPNSFANIFEQVAPAVVQIDVTVKVEQPQGGAFQIPGLPFQFVPPQGRGGQGEEDEPQTTQGAGSGFFISQDGFIVTNNHVVADATEIKVKMSDGRELPARLIGRDPGTDLAVIKVEGNDFKYVSFEETAQPRVGDWVIAVGNPFGLGGTATAGIVSAKARDIDPSGYNDYIQIDAAINRGNSGGPTFDIYGRVIGVNSAIYSPTGGSVGIGFAIPAETAKSITERLMRGQAIERGYVGLVRFTVIRDGRRQEINIRAAKRPSEEELAASSGGNDEAPVPGSSSGATVEGMKVSPLNAAARQRFGLADDVQGVVVTETVPGSKAAQLGIPVGSIIQRANNQVVTSPADLERAIAAARAAGRPGVLLMVRSQRGGAISVVLELPRN